MIATVLNAQNSQFSLSGVCPHCQRDSVFIICASPGSDPIPTTFPNYGPGTRIYAAMQCQGCREYILGLVGRPNTNTNTMFYVAHYPIGLPSDDAPSEIPENIASDFKEALRCRWVEAYNATGEMCRRALESSCNELDAPSGKLVDKIDWLAQQGIITGALKDVAHKIRLGGNYGAHAPEDPLNAEPMTAEHADALIEFIRDYFQHVYVMPKKLQKYDFTKKGMTKPTPASTP
jgi:hypothetical protein